MPCPASPKLEKANSTVPETQTEQSVLGPLFRSHVEARGNASGF